MNVPDRTAQSSPLVPETIALHLHTKTVNSVLANQLDGGIVTRHRVNGYPIVTEVTVERTAQSSQPTHIVTDQTALYTKKVNSVLAKRTDG